jgi:DNA polymerase III epsilon subunit-like protein
MVSLAAVVVAPDEAGVLTLGDTFYAELRPVAPRFDPRAAAIHGLDQDRLRAEGLDRRAFTTLLATWVKAHTQPGTQPVFVGHNAPFDWSFVAWVYAAEEQRNPFGYKALCTKALATGVLGLHWLDSGKETLERALALPAEDHDAKHRADYDAWYQALILLRLLERQGVAVRIPA